MVTPITTAIPASTLWEGAMTDDGSKIVVDLNGKNGEYLKWVDNGAAATATATTIIDGLTSSSATAALSAAAGSMLDKADLATTGSSVTGSTLSLALKGGGSVPIDLSAIANTPVIHDATLSGTGVVSSPLTIGLSANSGNAIALGTDGKLFAKAPTANNIVNHSGATAYTTTPATGTVRFSSLAVASGVILHNPTTTPGMVMILANSSPVVQPITGTVHKMGGVGLQTNIIAGASHTIQSIDGVWAVIDESIPNATPVGPGIDDIIDVTGATLPIIFPVTTIPGTPVFSPATGAASAGKIYLFANGQTAIWSGTQYISYTAPSNDYWSSVAIASGFVSPPDGAQDLVKRIRREGMVGIRTGALSDLDVDGSIGVACRVLPSSATPYAIGLNDTTIVVTGSINQPITFPAAIAYNRRIITIVTNPSDGAIVSLSSTSAIGCPDGGTSNNVAMIGKAASSATWQSNGTIWQLISWTERMHYQTADYPLPAGIIPTTFNSNVGTLVNNFYQLPATVEYWQSLDGNWTPNISLPQTKNASGKISIYCNSGFGQTVGSMNSDLPKAISISSGQSLHFEWANGLWRWVAVPNRTSPAIQRVNLICRGKTQQVISAWTTLTNWVEVIDATNSFTPATGIFVAPRAGLYQFSLGDGIQNAIGSYIGLSITKNGTQLYNFLDITSSANTYYMALGGLVELAAGDQVSPRAYATTNTNDQVSPSNCWFTITEINTNW